MLRNIFKNTESNSSDKIVICQETSLSQQNVFSYYAHVLYQFVVLTIHAELVYFENNTRGGVMLGLTSLENAT